MQDVQQLLDDLMHRQEQTRAASGVPARLLAEPSASKTASPAAHLEEAAGGAPAGQAPTEVASAPSSLQQAQAQPEAAAPAMHRSVSAPALGQPGAAAAAAGTTASPRSAPAGTAGSAVPAGAPGAASWMRLPSLATQALVPQAQPMPAAQPGGAQQAAPPVSVPLMSSALAAMLAGGMPVPPQGTSGSGGSSGSLTAVAEPAAAAAQAPDPALAEQVGRLQQQLLAQAHEQQRQLSMVQSMHQWAGRMTASLRQLQQQGRKAVAAAARAQEEAAAAKASLVQLASLHDSSQQQVCQLSLQLADLREQVQMLQEGGGGKRRRAAAAVAALACCSPLSRPPAPPRLPFWPFLAGCR